MPIYQFECPKCGHGVELMLCMGSQKRPVCGKDMCYTRMKKVLSPTQGIVKNPAVPPGRKRGK